MISLSVLFYLLMVLFVVIGVLRGLAKEILVSFSGILALFIIELILPKVITETSPQNLATYQLLTIAGVSFLGYQTPNIRRLVETGRFQRGSFKNMILGGLVGGINGYLLLGSAWYFMAEAGYPFSQITAPDAATEAGKAAAQILNVVAPNFLQPPYIYYALAIGSMLLIGVFL